MPMQTEPSPAGGPPALGAWKGILSLARAGSLIGRLIALILADRRLTTLIVVLVLGDFLAVLLHIGYELNVRHLWSVEFLRDPGFFMKYGRSYAAIYGFMTMWAIILTSAWLFVVSREAVYGAVAFVFLGILATAYFRIHVIMGDWIDESSNLDRIFSHKAHYVGEAISFALIGSALFIGLLVGCIRSSGEHGRIGILIAGTLVILAICDGALDLLHALELTGQKWVGEVMVVVEEGGELFSLTAAFAIMAAAAAGRHVLSEAASNASRQR
jgi:hypothetical protein